MLIITKKIKEILFNKNLSINKLAKLIGKNHSGNLGKMILGKQSFSKTIKEKLFPILEISEEEFQSWIIATKYDFELIQKAVDAVKNKSDKTIPVFTQNIDKILLSRKMSRTDLSKIIKYSQSGLNRMIIGQIGVSKPVMAKISKALEIPLSDLQTWVLADKYSLEVLLLALESSSV
jgi:DNA-binding Xre family transcriptional regulator